MVDKHEWKNNGACLNMDTELFFDKYEENLEVRDFVDDLCAECPLVRHCFAVGVSEKAWGVWGGIYMENGKISREFGKHRTKQDWAEVWHNLTIGK